MIDMKNSPNYDKIVNFLYEDNDHISKLLIEYYQDYLSFIKNKTSKNKMDVIFKEYTEKRDFYKFVQEYFKVNNSDLLNNYDKVIHKLSKLYQEYEENKYKKINNARWI